MVTHTHTLTRTLLNMHFLSLSFFVTYSPHVDEASAQERIQVPVNAGQTGDVEDFMTQACREQEEEVQQPVLHFILRVIAVLQRTNTCQYKTCWKRCLKVAPGAQI